MIILSSAAAAVVGPKEEEDKFPRTKTVYATSLNLFFIGPLLDKSIRLKIPYMSYPLLFLRSMVYCVPMTHLLHTTLFVPTSFGMALSGWVVGFYYASTRTTTIWSVLEIAFMTCLLQFTPLLGLHVLLGVYEVFYHILPSVNIMNIVLGPLTAGVVCLVWHFLLQLGEPLHTEPFVRFVHMFLFTRTIYATESVMDLDLDVQDYWILKGIRGVFGPITNQVMRSFKEVARLALVYIPLFALVFWFFGLD